MKALVLAGADINSVDFDGISVLQAAVIGGNKDCCQLLLILGADPDHADNDGDTPRNSVTRDDKEIMKLFEQYDAGLSAENLLDSSFIKELQSSGISIPNQESSPILNTMSESNSVMKALDEEIELDLDDDGDLF